jgi:hypothetical protein
MSNDLMKLKSRMKHDQTLPFNGWNNVLISLDKKLSILDPDYEILQIKEKFGTLRFYYKTHVKEKAVLEAMDRYTNQACDESSRICEFCGNAGSLRKLNNWYKTICEECFKLNEK